MEGTRQQPSAQQAGVEQEAARLLLNQIVEQQRTLAVAQAKLASLMIDFCDERRRQDEIDLGPATARPKGASKPGEFAADEVAMALSATVQHVRCDVNLARRVRSALPNVWQAWLVGSIDYERVKRIDQAGRRIVDQHTLAVLDDRVVDIAPVKTPKLLSSWLERFVAQMEPEQFHERHRRALVNRRVTMTQGLDGIAWLTGGMNAIDAASIDLRLTSLAQACGAADVRSMDQRRSDIYADLLLSRLIVESTGSSATRLHPAADVAPVDQHYHSPQAGEGALEGSHADATGGSTDGVQPENDPTDEITIRRVASPPVKIGVVVPIRSLIGESDAPGELIDRSASIPAQLVRDLAAHPGTLFYRLLTDERGSLLDVTELGRFPSERLGFAIKVRAGTCENPVCSVPAERCDIDHHQSVPEGPTCAANCGPKCRRHHRSATHAGFVTRRLRAATEWTTPTAHTYSCLDDPLPVDSWAKPVAADRHPGSKKIEFHVASRLETAVRIELRHVA